MSFDLLDWYNQMNQGDVILAYKGDVTSDLITSVLNDIEVKLEGLNENVKTKKKLYNVLVEALQNLYHHIDTPPQGDKDKFGERFAIFIVVRDGNRYRISTGNFVRPEKIQMLKDRIDQINFLSQEELKTLYKMILNNDEFSDKGGGGLGMIDIVRKTGNKLEYSFFNYSDDKNFFCLDVSVT